MYGPYVIRGRQRLVAFLFHPSIYNLFHFASYDFVQSGSDTVIHRHCLGSRETSNASPAGRRERQSFIDCRLCLVQRVLWIYSNPLSFWPFKTHTAHYLSVWSPPVNNNCYYSEWCTNRLCYFLISVSLMKADGEFNMLGSLLSSRSLANSLTWVCYLIILKKSYSHLTMKLPWVRYRNKLINK